MKPDEALSDVERTRANMWYRHTLITRLNDKRRGRIAIVMQRLHEDDMVGHVLELEPWKVVALPAIAQSREIYVIPTAFGSWTHQREEGEALHPEREPLAELEKYRRIQGPEIFTAQFLQAPVPPGGNLVKIEKFRRFDSNKLPEFEQTVQSWDTASKATQLSSYSVCTVWGVTNKQIYLIDVIRARFEYPDLRSATLALARGGYRGHRRPDRILIEDKGSGQSLIQDLKRDDISNVTAIKPDADKKIRMNSQTAVIADGRVHIPYDAPWLADYLQELIAFPLGRYDDQVDSTSQALKWFSELTDMPSIIRYYQMLVEEKLNGKKEDRRIVTLRCSNPSINVVYAKSGAQVAKSDDGLFRMEWRDAQYLLRTPGWVLVEDS